MDEKKRFIDKPYHAFSIFTTSKTGIDVRCPYCKKSAVVKADDHYSYFQCIHCGKQHKKERAEYRYQISEMCKKCERHFRLDLNDPEQTRFEVLNVTCPYCENQQQGSVQKIKQVVYSYRDVSDGIEHYFNYPLYYQTESYGKPIWAINREHLLYLIDYVEADIREDGVRSYQDYPDFYGPATQSDHLPKFIKLAKNRQRIAKLLRRLLDADT